MEQNLRKLGKSKIRIDSLNYQKSKKLDLKKLVEKFDLKKK